MVKKTQLKKIYCDSLYSYYKKLVDASKAIEPYTKQAEEYCNSINQDGYKKWKYLN